MTSVPNLLEYHHSITRELEVLKDRIRYLISHNLSDGEWKEAILRAVLRRHLPDAIIVGRGFVVTRDRPSTQIDILVLKRDSPTLFRDGDLVIVTPDIPGAIIEVKSSVQGKQEWSEVARKLADIGKICYTVGRNRPWLGIFSYEGDECQADNALEVICSVYQETGVIINGIACGNDYFIRYWSKGEYELGDSLDALGSEFWRSYHLEGLSPSYFIGNLVDAMCNIDRKETGSTWFAYREGKRAYMVKEKRIEDCRTSQGKL